jgi:hypothetical protein
MRIPSTLAVTLLGLALVAGGCGDDDADVGTGRDQGSSTTAPAATVPDEPADLVGTITHVEAFVPITEDCTPPEDLDPDGAVSNDDPPVCTPEDNDVVGTVLVEQDPDDPSGGRKISFTATTGTAFDGVAGFDDLAEGQPVETWIAGDMCAESYPEQCGLAAIRVTG